MFTTLHSGHLVILFEYSAKLLFCVWTKQLLITEKSHVYYAVDSFIFTSFDLHELGATDVYKY